MKVIIKNPAHACVRNFQGNGLISAKASMTSNLGVPDLVKCLSNLGRVTFHNEWSCPWILSFAAK